MRHHNHNRKLGLEKKTRTALLKSLAASLIIREKITTTEAKAKELRPYIEKLITQGRSGSLSARRSISARLGKGRAADKLFLKISPKYLNRPGGYTRITKMPPSRTDGAKTAQIELVQ